MASEDDETMDQDELEILVEDDDEIIAVPDEPLEHPSVARIKESEGIPVKRYQPVRVKSMENKPVGVKIVERDDDDDKISRTRRVPPPLKHSLPVRVIYSNDSEEPTEKKAVEEMSLDEVIAMRKDEFQKPKRYYEMSLSEVIEVKKASGEIPSDPNFAKRYKTDENGFKAPRGGFDKENGMPNSGRKIPRGRPMDKREDMPPPEFPAPRVQRAARTMKYTPEAGLRMMAEQGFLIVSEVSHMKSEDHPLHSKRRWRACYYDGRDDGTGIKGMGEAPRKALAKAAAALDFLEKHREARPDLKIPECEVPSGCRISPYVLIAVENLCSKLNIGEPLFTEDIMMIRGKEKYKFTLHVGSNQFWDASFDLKFAKYKAAKKAYDALNDTGKEFHYDPIVMGDDCLQDVEYLLIESNELHVVHANTRPPRRSGKMEMSWSAASTPVPRDDSSESGRESPASTATSASVKKILVPTVGECVMPQKLMRIRKSMKKRKLGLTPSSHNDAPNSEAMETESLLAPTLNLKDVERMDPPDTPQATLTTQDFEPAEEVVLESEDASEAAEMETESLPDPRLSARDPRLRQRMVRQSIVPDGMKHYPASAYIRDNWMGELRERVVQQLDRFREVIDDDETSLQLEMENFGFVLAPSRSRFCVITFVGQGTSSSFKLANLQAKVSLVSSIKAAQKCITKDGFVPTPVKLDSDETATTSASKPRNPFTKY